jgi:hypothetical protein
MLRRVRQRQFEEDTLFSTTIRHYFYYSNQNEKEDFLGLGDDTRVQTTDWQL